MEKTSIKEVMLKDHAKIGDLLEKLSVNFDRSEENIKALQDFKWNLERHFFIEEKIILIEYNTNDEESIASLSNFIKEHEKILNMIQGIEEGLKNKKKTDILEMKAMLLKHRDFEDDVFYPMLDIELSHEKKKIILQKIREYYKW